jgi:pilus assembly protein CpaB
MMESVNRKVVIISLILALFTSFLVYIYIKKATSRPDIIEYINVYVAARSMPPKYKITESDIKQVKVSREYLNSKAVLNKADIVGRRLNESVIEGEQILKDRLVDNGKTNLAYRVPEGKRAVSININDQINVSNLVRPGDFVDIIASFDKEEVEEASGKVIYPRITKTVIQNIEILAIGQDQTITEEKIKEPPKTVTLAVTPQEAEKLVYASEYAVLRLALRPVEDEMNINTPGVIRNDIVPGKGTFKVPNQ